MVHLSFEFCLAPLVTGTDPREGLGSPSLFLDQTEKKILGDRKPPPPPRPPEPPPLQLSAVRNPQSALVPLR